MYYFLPPHPISLLYRKWHDYLFMRLYSHFQAWDFLFFLVVILIWRETGGEEDGIDSKRDSGLAHLLAGAQVFGTMKDTIHLPCKGMHAAT